jgi:hypothetical protein
MRAYGLHEAAVLPGPLFFSCYVPVLCLLFGAPSSISCLFPECCRQAPCISCYLQGR